MSRSVLSGPDKVRAFLGLGGNLGDPRAAMRAALDAVQADAGSQVVAVSSLYRTPPWGKTDQPDFLNAVAAIDTSRAPRDLLALCLGTEHSLHRVRRERWGPRTIDIDILLYGDRNVNEEGLQIPHPRMLERAFVMVPLTEIAGDLELSGRRSAEIAAGLDAGGMQRLAGPDWWQQA